MSFENRGTIFEKRRKMVKRVQALEKRLDNRNIQSVNTIEMK